MIQLVGDAAREQREREEKDAPFITIAEARLLVNAILNDFIANHLTQHMVPVIEHYVLQMPALIDARLDARGGKDAMVDRIMAALESEAKGTVYDSGPVHDTLGDPNE